MSNFDFPFEIKYDNILHTNDLLPMVRLLAADLMKTPYMSLGTYFQTARETDLEMIMEISEDENDERMGDILLMAEMLSRAEGVETKDIEDVQTHVNSFISLAAVTLLDRKNLVDAVYDNMSFGEEFQQHIIVKRKPGDQNDS